MNTTIDKAGRLVVPKPVRTPAGLHPGTRVRSRVREGRVEIEPVPLDSSLERRGNVVVGIPREDQPVLTASEVEATISTLREGVARGAQAPVDASVKKLRRRRSTSASSPSRSRRVRTVIR